MESRHLLIEGGLIIGHRGRLNGAGLSNYLRKLFEVRPIDQAKYIVSDFSEITEIAIEEYHGHQIGTLIRELRGRRITLRRPIRWAVITAEEGVESLAGAIVAGAGDGIYLKMFTNLFEAVLWGKNPRAFTEISNFIAWQSFQE